MSKSIIIDVGHGGTDTGAVGFGVYEKNWNLKMSLYQFKRLKEMGANVSITRTNDKTIDPETRGRMIKSKYDVCISNHFNAFNGHARGVETIHSIHHSSSFASDIANELVKETGLSLRRVFTKRIENTNSDWYFMHRLTVPTETVIIEYGFLDNQSDHNYFKNERNFYNAGEAVLKAVCRKIGVKYKSANQKPTKKDDDIMYKVQTGAFNDIKNAESLADKLKKDGYDTYIVYDGLSPAPAPARKTIEEYADMIERTTITGEANRAKYLGLTLDEYRPVQEELNRRYS